VTKVRLPGITKAEASRYEHVVESEATLWNLSGSFAELETGLAAAEKEKANVLDIDNTPPNIVVVYERAILVEFDGPPVVQAIEGSNLVRVANTPFAVVYDPASGNYYLNGASAWYQAPDALGPWDTIADPPAEVRAVVPPDTSADDQNLGPPPRIVTATEPTELLSIDGQPSYAGLPGDEVLYVTNTESDILRDVGTQSVYVLIAGRWFRAPTLDGPWTFVRSDSLPDSFARIEVDSPKANVLASVSGTDQAADAVADAEIAQTTAVNRSAVILDVGVTYDGSPVFEPIPGTALQYAVNTDAEVILS